MPALPGTLNPGALVQWFQRDMNYELKFEHLLARLSDQVEEEDISSVRLAYEVALAAHSDQFRDEGSPYIVHPVRVALTLVDELSVFSHPLICSALLHDVIEDSEVTRSDLERMFDEQIAEIVWLLTKVEDVSLREYLARIEAAAETGAPIVKLCDRLDNMRSVLDTPNLEKKRRYIRTTEELYLPLAARTNAYLYDELSRSLEEARSQLRTVESG